MAARFIVTVEELADVVLSACAEAELSQLGLAELAEVDLGFVEDVEAGVPRHEATQVLKVLDALGVDVSAIPSVAAPAPVLPPRGQRWWEEP